MKASKTMPREKRSLWQIQGEKKNMARRVKTREELQEEIDDLKGENQGLQDQLDSIADIVAPADEDEHEDEDEDQD
jgi:cell division protein FtsB